MESNLVHDNAEESLLREVEVYRNSEDELECLYAKVQNQLKYHSGA